MSENEQGNRNFTSRQQRALLSLVATPSVAEAARQSRLGYSTLQRYLKDDYFRAELTRQRQEASDLTSSQLQGLMLQSVVVLAEAMRDPSANVRLRAARTALSYGIQLGQLEKFQQQLEAVEDSLPTWALHYRKL